MLKKLLVLTLIALLSLTVLAACTGDTGSDPTDENGTNPPGSTGGDSATEAADGGGELRKTFVETEYVNFATPEHDAVMMTNPHATGGAKFTVDFTIDGITLWMPTSYDDEGNYAVLKLFKWDTDYNTTVASVPVATFKRDDIGNNEQVTFEIDEDLAPAGTYLWLIDDAASNLPDCNVGMWCVRTKDDVLEDGVEFFYNDQPTDRWLYKFIVGGYVWK